MGTAIVVIIVIVVIVVGVRAIGSATPLLFSLVGAGALLAIAFHLQADFLKQLGSAKYPSTFGQIIRSRVDLVIHKNEHSYKPDIFYSYEINGKKYKHHRFRYIERESPHRDQINELTSKYPIGSQAIVFYNPNNYDDALLNPGITGKDCLDLFASIPLIVIAYFILFYWIKKLYYLRRKQVAGGLKVIRRRQEVRLRLVRYSPLTIAIITFGVAGLLGYLLGLLFIEASLIPPLIITILVVAVTLFVGFRIWLLHRSGVYDFVLDRARAKVRLPTDPDRNELIFLDLADIISVFMEKHLHKGGPTCYSKLRLRPPAQPQTVCKWLEPRRTSQLTKWLSEQLGVRREPDEQIRLNAEKTP